MRVRNENEVPTLERGSVKGEAGLGHLRWGTRYTLEQQSVAFWPCQGRDILSYDTMFKCLVLRTMRVSLEQCTP